MARVHQLVSKTNQFNLTTSRYGAGELEAFAVSDSHFIGVASATDRFGDLGMIAVYLLERTGSAVEIRCFLLSCRALGRGIETVVMNALKEDAVRWGGDGVLRAVFVPTAKNTPARGFLESQGLEESGTSPDGAQRFHCPLTELLPVSVPHIAFRRVAQ
jgi:FkbH-like protein